MKRNAEYSIAVLKDRNVAMEQNHKFFCIFPKNCPYKRSF